MERRRFGEEEVGRGGGQYIGHRSWLDFVHHVFRQGITQVTASWITQGRFLPGQVQSGNRVLVYAGPIATPFMEDVLTFRFSLDGTLVQHSFPVSFHFEMDED